MILKPHTLMLLKPHILLLKYLYSDIYLNHHVDWLNHHLSLRIRHCLDGEIMLYKSPWHRAPLGAREHLAPHRTTVLHM